MTSQRNFTFAADSFLPQTRGVWGSFSSAAQSHSVGGSCGWWAPPQHAQVTCLGVSQLWGAPV